MYHSTLGWRAIKKKKVEGLGPALGGGAVLRLAHEEARLELLPGEVRVRVHSRAPLEALLRW